MAWYGGTIAGFGMPPRPPRPAVTLAPIAIEVEALRDDDLAPRIPQVLLGRFLHADARDQPGQRQFGVRVAHAGHAEQRRLRFPEIGLEARELEFDRQIAGVLRDVRVYAVGKGRKDGLAVRVVAGPFLVVEGTSEHEEPRLPIAVECGGAKDFREPSLVLHAPHVELPQTILRGDVALREEQVLFILRVDVRHAPFVANDLDRFAHPRNIEIAVEFRERLARNRFQIGAAAGGAARRLGRQAERRIRTSAEQPPMTANSENATKHRIFSWSLLVPILRPHVKG